MRETGGPNINGKAKERFLEEGSPEQKSKVWARVGEEQ